jgi:inorganic triphosphatase YgiF
MTTGQRSRSSRTKEPSATDHQEIEWQFDASDLESVAGWLDQHNSGSSDLVVAPESTVEITDTYYDTDDWRLYRAGYALRVRNTEGAVEATMKSLTPAEDSLRRRREISELLEDDRPSTLKQAGGAVGGRSRTLVSGRELRPLFTIETRRKGFALLLEGSTDGKNMLETLDSVRYERLLSSFAEMLRLGPAAELELAQTNGKDQVGEPVTAAAPALISDRYRKWSKAAKRLDETSSPEAFHDVRKKGKRLRYTLEFVSEVYGRPVQKLVKPLKALQDDLGDHQDAVVTAAYLRELGPTTGQARVPRGVAFTMGVYAERCTREAKDLRSVVPGSKPFRVLTKGKTWKKFEKVLESRSEANLPNKGVR